MLEGVKMDLKKCQRAFVCGRRYLEDEGNIIYVCEPRGLCVKIGAGILERDDFKTLDTTSLDALLPYCEGCTCDSKKSLRAKKYKYLYDCLWDMYYDEFGDIVKPPFDKRPWKRLKKISTRTLVKELQGRKDVRAVELDVEQSTTLSVDGPAAILLIR